MSRSARGSFGLDLRGSGSGALRLGTTAFRAGLGGLRRVAGAAPLGLPLAELEAKLRAFELFRWAEAEAGVSGRNGCELEAAVQGALRLDPFDAVWVLEGLGYALGPGAARPGLGPGRGVPRRCWIPLHTGTGMALAEQTVAGLGAAQGEAEQRRHVANLAELCDRLSAPGYALATFEPFGFMVKMLDSRLLRPLTAALSGLGPELSAAFWHGAGRGCYFAAYAASAVRGMTTAWRSAPGPAEALEALTGATWALTLVNLPRPSVVAAGLAAAQERLPEEAVPALTDGVVSAVRLWHHGRGLDPLLAAFVEHREPRERIAAAWEGLAVVPCRRMLRTAAAPGSGRPGDLFRHHPVGRGRARGEAPAAPQWSPGA